MKNIKIIFFLFFFLSNKSFTEEIPIIVISPGKSIQSLANFGTNVDLIDNDTITNSNENFLGNIIDSNITSANIFQSGGAGSVMGVQLRGLEKRYSTVYIDGVKMSDPSTPDNSFYFQNILKDSIDHVEILKGNQSSLYGPNAIGGTIQIFTKKGKKNQKPSIEINKGSNNTTGVNYSIGGANEKINYFLGLNKFSTDGISSRNDDEEDDGYRNKSLNTSFGYKFNNDFWLQSSLRYVNTDLNYDEVNKSLTDLLNKSKDTEASYSLKFFKDNNLFTNSLNFSKYYIERKTIESGNGKQNYFGYRDSVSWNSIYNINLDNRIVFGSDFEIEAAKLNGDYAPSDTGWTKIFFDKKADESIFSQYFDYQFRPYYNLFATIGLRNDEHTSSGRKKSGRATIVFKINEENKISTTFGSGIRFPSLYDLHYADGNTNASGGGTYPNDGYAGLRVEDLKPERANSFDLGYTKKLKNINSEFNITYFYIEQKNPLNSDSRNNWKMQNTMGVNSSKGVEFEFNWKPDSKKFGLDFNYTFTDSYDSNTCSLDIINSRGCNITSDKLKDAKVRVPRNIFFSNLSYTPSNNLKNSLKIKFVDEVRDFGDINNNFKDVILKDYIVFDLASDYNISKNYFLTFQAKNLFNEIYEQAYGYSSPGRSFFLGAKMLY